MVPILPEKPTERAGLGLRIRVADEQLDTPKCHFARVD
jgi:hypothetical protein